MRVTALKILSGGAAQGLVGALAPQLGAETGFRLEGEFGGRRQARRGELLDVLALPGFVATRGATPEGLLTYRRSGGECELAFVGLTPDMSGLGHGRWLLEEAVKRAWRQSVSRVHVHTCSLDHPAAMGAYRRAGFTAYKRAVERFPDPRLVGILPKDCAPQIPLFEAPATEE